MSNYSIKDVEGLKAFFSQELIDTVSTKLQLSKLIAARLIGELTNYLAVVAAAQAKYPNKHYSPTSSLDEVWHIWIEPENRRSYDEFCDKYLGRRVEHTSMQVQPRDSSFYAIASELGLKLDKFVWYIGEDDSDCG